MLSLRSISRNTRIAAALGALWIAVMAALVVAARVVTDGSHFVGTGGRGEYVGEVLP